MEQRARVRIIARQRARLAAASVRHKNILLPTIYAVYGRLLATSINGFQDFEGNLAYVTVQHRAIANTQGEPSIFSHVNITKSEKGLNF